MGAESTMSLTELLHGYCFFLCKPWDWHMYWIVLHPAYLGPRWLKRCDCGNEEFFKTGALLHIASKQAVDRGIASMLGLHGYLQNDSRGKELGSRSELKMATKR